MQLQLAEESPNFRTWMSQLPRHLAVARVVELLAAGVEVPRWNDSFWRGANGTSRLQRGDFANH